MADDSRDPLTHEIIGAALTVYAALGPGLLESAYEDCMDHELKKRALKIQRQPTLPLLYDGIRVEYGFRPDLIVEDRVIVEIKTVRKFEPVHEAQLLTYLKLGGIRVGLLINFHAFPLRDGIKRMVL